ncbi:MAG: hypothetical protein DRJ50_10495 [Actinobacteria bacterium]|nr:MAG: hypothetical protein DRJ50_10495 [Actinomycetota bacterium]
MPGTFFVWHLFRRTGGVWQSRYQAKLVDEGGYLAEVCSLLDTDMERLAGRTKDRETAELRLVAALGVERWRQRCKDLAGVLGKNPDVVSYWVVEGVRRRSNDPVFAERFDDYDEKLENATRLEGGRRQAEPDGAKNEK